MSSAANRPRWVVLGAALTVLLLLLPAVPAWAALPVSNSFEGGTNGTTISAANSGGSSGTAFDTVTIGAGATLAFDSTRAAHGGLSAKVATGGSAQSMVQWTTAVGTQTEVWGRVYVYFTAVPSPAVKLLRFFNGASQAGAINVNISGFLVLLDATNTQVAVGSVAVTTGAWARIEFHVLANATTGAIEAKLFNTADGTTVSELVSATNKNTNSALTDYRFGQTTAVASVGPFWMDDLQINNTGWPGPVGSLSVCAPATASVSVTLNGTDQTPSYAPALTVADTTGTGAGWNLTISSTQFTTGGATPKTLSTTASTVTGVTFTCPGGGCTNPTNTVTYPVTVPTSGTAKFFNAAVGTGLGTFTVTPTVQVSVPANSFAGTYTSTLTIAVVSGP